jgi:hypothetical protein
MDRLDLYLQWGTRTPELDRRWVNTAIDTDDLALLEALLSRQMVDYTSLYGSYGTAYTTALGLAVQKRRPAMVSLLVDVVPVDDADFNGYTPLYSAVDTGQDDIAVLLISFGADVNFPRVGVTPFFNAVYMGNVGLAAVMLANWADVHATYGHWTVLAVAVHNNDFPMVDLIMRWLPDWQSDLEFLISIAIDIKSTDMLLLLTKDLNRTTYDATPHVREAVYKGCPMALDFFAPFQAFGPVHVTSIYPHYVRSWTDSKKVEKDMAKLMSKFVGADMSHVIKSFLVPTWTIYDTGGVFIMARALLV